MRFNSGGETEGFLIQFERALQIAMLFCGTVYAQSGEQGTEIMEE